MKEKKYKIQKQPFIVPTNDGKLIEEHFGNATDGNSEISIAHMIAPPGWSEPFQTPEFDEYTYIIRGKKQFIIEGETVVLKSGESIKIERNNITILNLTVIWNPTIDGKKSKRDKNHLEIQSIV